MATKKQLEKQIEGLIEEVREYGNKADKYEVMVEVKQLSLNATIDQLHATGEALTKALDLVEFLRPPKKNETVAYTVNMQVANYESPKEDIHGANK